MLHPIYRVVGFQAVAPYTLRVNFDDGTTQTIDFQPVLAGHWYGPLRDLKLFNQVQLDPEVDTLVWPNGADFDPATLHDWPEHLTTLKTMARQWAKAEAEDEWLAVQHVQEALKQYGPFESLAHLAEAEAVPLSTLAQAAREGRLPAVPVGTGWLARASAVKKRIGLAQKYRSGSKRQGKSQRAPSTKSAKHD